MKTIKTLKTFKEFLNERSAPISNITPLQELKSYFEGKDLSTNITFDGRKYIVEFLEHNVDVLKKVVFGDKEFLRALDKYDRNFVEFPSYLNEDNIMDWLEEEHEDSYELFLEYMKQSLPGVSKDIPQKEAYKALTSLYVDSFYERMIGDIVDVVKYGGGNDVFDIEYPSSYELYDEFRLSIMAEDLDKYIQSEGEIYFIDFDVNYEDVDLFDEDVQSRIALVMT